MSTKYTKCSVVLLFALLADTTMLSPFSGQLFTFSPIQVVFAWVTVGSSLFHLTKMHLHYLEVCLNTINTNIVCNVRMLCLLYRALPQKALPFFVFEEADGKNTASSNTNTHEVKHFNNLPCVTHRVTEKLNDQRRLYWHIRLPS